MADIQEVRHPGIADQPITPEVEDTLPDPMIKSSGVRIAGHLPDESWGSKQVEEIKQNTAFNADDTLRKTFNQNPAVSIWKQLEGAYNAGDIDPNWRDGTSTDWLKLNRTAIPETDDWRYKLARNADEAQSILDRQRVTAQDAKELSMRHGFLNTTASAIAAFSDPLTLATLPLGSEIVAGGRIAKTVGGGVLGGLAGAGTGYAQYQADPNSSVGTVALAGLAGMGFGAVGGLFATTSKEAMIAHRGTVGEIKEGGQVGFPRAKENLYEEQHIGADNYGSAQFDNDLRVAIEKEVFAEEQARKQTTAGQPAVGAEAPKPAVIPIDEIEQHGWNDGDFLSPDQGKASIGARQLNATGTIADMRNARQQATAQVAQTRLQQLGLDLDWTDPFKYARGKGAATDGLAWAADKFNTGLQKLDIFNTDFDRLFNTGSATAKLLAYDTGEHAAGIVRNNRSSSRMMEHYQKELGDAFLPFDDAFKGYGADQGASWWRIQTDPDLRAQFNKEVQNELAGRYYDQASHTPSGNPHVTRAADSIDQAFAKEIDIVKGRPGEHSVAGTDNIAKTSGYSPQKWSGLNMAKLGKGQSKNAVREAIAEAYGRTMPHVPIADRRIWAEAVVDRAHSMDNGINTNLIGMLQGDGRQELANVLSRNGMSDPEITRFIDRLTGAMEEKGAPGWSKARLDVDPRFVASNGIRIGDLMDNDYQAVMPARFRRSAGSAALARKGIRSRADQNHIIDTILAEQRARGESIRAGRPADWKDVQGNRDWAADALEADKHVDREYLEDYFNYFGQGPIGGGLSPVYARIKKVTNLALLNQLGLTQMADLGHNIAAVGVESFLRNIPDALNYAMNKPTSELVQEMRNMHILVPEEKLFRSDLTHEFEKTSTQGEWGRQADRILNKAQYAQGYISLFNHIRNFQQAMATSSFSDKVMRHIKGTTGITPERWADLGLTQQHYSDWYKYVQNGTVEFKDGYLHKLNLNKWDPLHAEDFALMMGAKSNQLVSKAMAGESNVAFHKDGLASLFTHLKTFTMLGMNKNFVRELRYMDPETLGMMAYTLGVGAAVHVTKNTINNRTENLTFKRIASGAIGNSSLFGWAKIPYDALQSVTGNGSSYSGRDGLLSPLVAIETANRMVKAPVGVAKVLGTPLGLTQYTNADINNIQALPIVGNMLGASLFWNSLKHDRQ